MSGEGLVHRFADPLPLDEARARRWLGVKGASLAEMTRMGLPVPPGFTLSVEAWSAFESAGRLPEEVTLRVREELERLESATGLRFGDARAPLLVAVRSGAPSSMPGMLETVLDVGVNSDVARALAHGEGGSERFGLDVRRRFLESYGAVVLGVPREAFDAVVHRRDLRDLDAHALGELVGEYDRLVAREAGEPVPEDPWEQLVRSIEGVTRSWRAQRAEQYRAAHRISAGEGTGVTVQAMVFGNLGPRSGAGVVFSRNPATGERALYGEWLAGAQGEDVVSGRRTPSPLTSAQVRRGQEDESLERAMPEVLAEIRSLCDRLEARYGDAQDVEITVERGRLFVLQCRPAKRTARAAARMAVEMVEEGMLERRDALARVEPASLRQLLTPRLPDPQALAEAGLTPVARGLAASLGAAVGRIVLDARAARERGPGELILVRAETVAEDVDTMRSVAGILTAAGGLTSHAAVVARAMGKPCVAGATSLHVDYARRVVAARSELGTTELAEGDTITIDGNARPRLRGGRAGGARARVRARRGGAGLGRRAALGARPGRGELDAPRARRRELRRGRHPDERDQRGDDGGGGEGPVWMIAESAEAARAALALLRPGRDVLVTSADVAADASGVTLGARLDPAGGAVPAAQVLLVDVPDAESVERLASLRLPQDRVLALRGEGRSPRSSEVASGGPPWSCRRSTWPWRGSAPPARHADSTCQGGWRRAGRSGASRSGRGSHRSGLSVDPVGIPSCKRLDSPQSAAEGRREDGSISSPLRFSAVLCGANSVDSGRRSSDSWDPGHHVRHRP
ncbi:MAG: PEP-utilizing enzyme [Sandaracinaceae bacterium]|nr:PEP-utilizing enzyme [Sandaracinaceae bacterium]